MISQAPIVPIAISGTYDLWNAIWRFKRPELVMKILPPLPPVPRVSRNERKDVLTRASYQLMHEIYQELTDEELERYKVYMRQGFTGRFEVKDGDESLFANARNYEVLAELVSKKNLFSTFHEHLKIPVIPFLHLHRYRSLAAMRAAVNSLYDAIRYDVPGYIEYRLGKEKELQILAELDEIRSILRSVENRRIRLRFVVEIEEDKNIDITLDPPPVEETTVGAM
jgi:uncharacterized protein (UPF0216 family)